jgi:hypothetical protein
LKDDDDEANRKIFFIPMMAIVWYILIIQVFIFVGKFTWILEYI